MTDFGAVVAELRLFHHNEAADAVEALAAESADLADGVERLAGFNESLKGDLAAVTRERDALQQQLDSDNFESLRSRIAALEAVIARVKDMADRDDVGAWDAHQGLIALVLAEAPSTVLDQVIREAKAEAVEAARDAIMPPVNWNLRPDGTEMPGTQHIDEALHDIHVQLSEVAAAYRSGGEVARD